MTLRIKNFWIFLMKMLPVLRGYQSRDGDEGGKWMAIQAKACFQGCSGSGCGAGDKRTGACQNKEDAHGHH